MFCPLDSRAYFAIRSSPVLTGRPWLGKSSETVSKFTENVAVREKPEMSHQVIATVVCGFT